MRGPRILLLVLLAVAALIWVALSDDPAQDVRRGLDESNLALQAVERELDGLEPAYQMLTRRGVMLDLRAEHDALRSRVAVLRARRLRLADDPKLERHQVLPAFRALVEESDEALSFARALGRRIEARQEFILTSSPLLRDGRALRDRLLAAHTDDPVLRGKLGSLAGWFSELESHAQRSNTLLQQNPEQGAVMAAATLKALQEFQAQAQQLLADLDQDS